MRQRGPGSSSSPPHRWVNHLTRIYDKLSRHRVELADRLGKP